MDKVVSLLKATAIVGGLYASSRAYKFYQKYETSQYSFSVVTQANVPEIKLHYPLPRVKKQVEEGLTKMVHDIHFAFEKTGIPYSTACGTALGAFRHSGVIPWDNDNDLVVLESDKELIREKVFPILEELGYEMSYYPGRFFCRSKADHQLVADMFFVKEDPERGLFVYADPYTRKRYHSQMYHLDTFTEPEYYPFGGLPVKCPHDTPGFITRAYSKAALTESPSTFADFKEYWWNRFYYHHQDFRDEKIERGKKIEKQENAERIKEDICS